MIPIAQIIKVKTATHPATMNVVVVEEGPGQFSVLMSATAFPRGTTFKTAEDAVVAARTALNAILVPDKIIEMTSKPVEEFVSNTRLAQLV